MNVPRTEAQMIGSVGVRHAEITSDEMKFRLGNKRWMIAVKVVPSIWEQRSRAGIPATTIHPNAIVGTTMTRRPLACFAIYFTGSSTPIVNRPTANTARSISRVTKELSDPHVLGLKIFAQ
jgi:hypothetical protein